MASEIYTANCLWDFVAWLMVPGIDDIRTCIVTDSTITLEDLQLYASQGEIKWKVESFENGLVTLTHVDEE